MLMWLNTVGIDRLRICKFEDVQMCKFPWGFKTT